MIVPHEVMLLEDTPDNSFAIGKESIPSFLFLSMALVIALLHETCAFRSLL